jgi:hypothetical protein
MLNNAFRVEIMGFIAMIDGGVDGVEKGEQRGP